MAVSFFVMFRPKSKRMKIHTALKIPCALLTFVFMTLIWGVVGLGGIGQVGELLIHIFNTSVNYVSFEALEKLAAFKYTMVPFAAAVLMMFVSRVMLVGKKSEENDYTLPEIIMRSAAVAVLVAVFIICVIILLPQFPQLGTFSSGVYFV